ncbi:MAG: helix-turn-helix domain-containing protein, partial [Enterococcus sp.]|nr:helix-turn-helix domain-containing protein [Enterococcus sp.]
LTPEKRKVIEIRLGDGRTFEAIGEEIGVSATTVSREVRRNRELLPDNANKCADRNDCRHYDVCDMRRLCGGAWCHGNTLCRGCASVDCTASCGAYEPRKCSACDRPPYVCNPCRRKPSCTLPRHVYRARSAQAASEVRAAESRSGLDMTEGEAERMVATVRAGRAKGQSVHHIFATNDMPCTEGNFYKLVREGRLDFPSIELSKAVRYKKRRRRPEARAHEAGFYAGRTMEDFLRLPDEVRAARTEGDTVWGPKGSPECLLSLDRVDLHFQIYLRLRDHTAGQVVAALDWLEVLCGSPEAFAGLFDPLLVDRGSEFDDIEGIERSCLAGGEPRCRVFFADPQRPDQKGSCEKNHVELRKVCPKGTPFGPLTPFELAEITSHVNSTVRYKCGDVSPMSLALRVFPREVIDGLGLRLVPPADVVSRPGVLYDPEGPGARP